MSNETTQNANAFGSTFYFLQTHYATLKNKKSLQANAQDNSKVQCKLDTTTLRTDRRAADNRRLAQWRVTWLIEHSTSLQLLWCINSFVLRNPPLRQAPNR
jgi:hypothetical protein